MHMKWVLAAMLGLGAVVCAGAAGLAQPTPPPASVESIAPMVLNGYSRFPLAIGTAPVNDMDNHRVGSMQKLLATPDGQPSAIEIWLPSGHTMTVAASNVSYDEQHNSVTVGLNDAQLGLNTAPSGH
jgi:type IV pilus biogenesis protein CpaD/CtpE